jgi:hypothetical protein
LEPIIIPWSFIVISVISGGFGSMLGVFLIAPLGATNTMRVLDFGQRVAGGAIAAGLWNVIATEASGANINKIGHVIGVGGGIGFVWWFIGGGIALFLNRFRQTGPTRLPLPGRWGWLAELLGSMAMAPPDPRAPTQIITPPPSSPQQPTLPPAATGVTPPPTVPPTVPPAVPAIPTTTPPSSSTTPPAPGPGGRS